MLIEKAWAKLHGSYQAIIGGTAADALYCLTACKTNRVDFAEPEVARDLASNRGDVLWQNILDSFNRIDENNAVFVTVSGAKPAELGAHEGCASGLLSDHAYAMVEARNCQGHRLVKIQNPWGSYEWQGDWSDDSPLWTESMKEEVNFVNADDGAFYMSFEDFFRCYSEITVCEAGEVMFEKTCNGEWVSGENSAGGAVKAVGLNPRYLLQNTASKVTIVLEQTSLRQIGGASPLFMGFMICKDGGDKVPYGGMIGHEIVYSSVMRTWRVIHFPIKLPPKQGPYIIVPHLEFPGIDMEFSLTVRSGSELMLRGIPLPRPKTEAELAMSLPKIDMKMWLLGCAFCGHPRQDEICFATDNIKPIKRLGDTTFHVPCFKCIKCKTVPPSTTAVNEEGRVQGWCAACYESSKVQRCDQCNKPLGKTWARVKKSEKMAEVHPECKRAWFDSIPSESETDDSGETDSEDDE